MGFQDNLELFLNLSRKELQELCRKNSLPANRSTTQLAKSLASFFKREVASSGTTEAGSCNACLPDTVSGGKPSPEGEAAREYDNYEMIPVIEENGSGGKQYPKIQHQLESSGFMNHQTLDNVCDKGALAIDAFTFNKESDNVFECSLSEPGDMSEKSPAVGDVQHASLGSQLSSWCYHGSIKTDNQNSENSRNCIQGLLVNTTRSNKSALSSGCPIFLESPTRVADASSYQSSVKSSPSFDFFVMSDEGVNLYVDLSSSPLEWMKNLKDEVCIDEKMELQCFGSLSNHSSNSLNADDHIKSLQSETIGLNFQKNETERDTGCTKLTLSSVFNHDCLLEVYPLDVTLASSNSSILTSNGSPVDISATLEGSQLASSCIAYSNFPNLKAVDNTSLHQEDSMLRQGELDISFRVEQNNFYHEDAEVCIPGNSSSTICDKNNILKSNNHLNNVDGFDVVTKEIGVFGGSISFLERDSSCRIMLGSGELDGQLSAISERQDLAVLEKDELECSNFLASLDKNSKRSCSPEFDEATMSKQHHSNRSKKKRYLGCTISSIKEVVTDVTIPRRSSRFLSK